METAADVMTFLLGLFALVFAWWKGLRRYRLNRDLLEVLSIADKHEPATDGQPKHLPQTNTASVIAIDQKLVVLRQSDHINVVHPYSDAPGPEKARWHLTYKGRVRLAQLKKHMRRFIVMRLFYLCTKQDDE